MSRRAETYRQARRNAYRAAGSIADWKREQRFINPGERGLIIHQSLYVLLVRAEQRRPEHAVRRGPYGVLRA